ncbi:hypothetical protein JCGZ_12253 [Jatropha curcas]|uniref:DNA-directed RNA polymerase III subunit RPC5 n=1 Tax=Jatropha curcas TaxID=180498 RepID=A0A067K6S2_JATCU|nr:DNA-directed RNA polymerase III subunit RPC5 [Jatropha curcas]XP_012079065.1 DNA-directed RNA polymerase III subunit RPC5 [Jatropha curcas]KDP31792.1 hypothetical protein JCGZ_12253 [Jatropha curcas]
MDLDDFDELGGPKQVPSRTSKFAPKSSKFKPQPKEKVKTEPSAKPELQESVSVPKVEPQKAFSDKKNEGEEEVKPKIETAPKTEPSVSNNGHVKMEIDGKVEVRALPKVNDPMDEDKHEEEAEGGEEEEEEDMIVREIDVFFTPSIDSDTQLYVMQYPLRPCWRPYELDEKCEEVRVKPQSTEVQVDLSIDETTNWDPAQASKLNLKKQTLSSSFMPSCTTGYAVGVLIGNKLHLNPIHAVVQLRPSLEHVNSNDLKRRNIASFNIDPTVKIGDSSEGKPIGPSKKQIKRTEVANDQISDAEKSWISLKYHGSKSDFSSSYLQKMMAEEGSPMEFTMSPYDYMSSLCPVASNNAKSKGPSRRFLLSLPLEERMKKLLIEGPPVQRFSVLKHFAPEDTVEDVLTVVQKHGQLVQGLWAPRTALLFPDSKEVYKPPARDYILLLFSKSLVISTSQITSLPARLKEPVRAFLNLFAVERPSFRDWKFKESPDAAFMKLHPEVVKKQVVIWEGVEKKLTGFLSSSSKGGKQNDKRQPTLAHNLTKELDPHKIAPKSASVNRVPIRTTITSESREALLKVLPKVLQTHKVCSFELIRQGLRDLAVSQSTLPKADPRIAKLAADGADAPLEELQEIISEVATNIHGSYVLKSSPDHPQYDVLRKVVIDLLLARGPNAKLKKSEVYEAAKLVLKRDINTTEYTKVMTDFCESKASAWVLKSGDGKPS